MTAFGERQMGEIGKEIGKDGVRSLRSQRAPPQVPPEEEGPDEHRCSGGIGSPNISAR